MSFLRSKTINHYQFIMPRQNAHRTVSLIGRMGSVQFEHFDININERVYMAQVKLCEQTLQKIRVIQETLNRQGLRSPQRMYGSLEYQAFLEIVDRRYRIFNRSESHLLEAVVDDIDDTWKGYQRLMERKQELQNQMEGLQEQMAVLKAGKLFFGENYFKKEEQSRNEVKQIKFKCGVIAKHDQLLFTRTIHRISKGFCFFHMVEWMSIFDLQNQNNNQQQEKQSKVVFFLFHGYGQSQIMQNKIMRLLQSYKVKCLNFPQQLIQLNKQIEQLQKLILQNRKLHELVASESKDIFKYFLQVQPSDNPIKLLKIQYYQLYLLQQKQIYQQLNQMKSHHSFYQAEVYVEADRIETVTTTIQNQLAAQRLPLSQFIPLLSQTRPTSFTLNQVTTTPFKILCAYGIPHYKQINPSIFNLVTFPFLFGIMFGDIVHGSILFVFALSLIFWQTKFKHPFIAFLIPHKYTMALMGFFSFYCGFIYNEYISLSLNLFGSCYEIVENVAILKSDCVYWLGVDPIWAVAQNSLNFTNSLKMKIAVIIAIVHMTFGLILKALNLNYKRHKLYILIELFPQFIFFTFLFGYMDFLIVYKWLQNWSDNTAVAPSIITTMINLPLKIGKTDNCCGGQPMWGQYGDTSQNNIQTFILIISLICIPLILCCKPIHIYFSNKKKAHRDLEYDLRQDSLGENKDKQQLIASDANDQHGQDMNEVVVYQLIQTIQFVLGCVSNTASYLRLWALSLAHAQLSDVFFEQTVKRGLKIGFSGILYNIVLFPIFAGLTFGILLCMDTMQCFLHTLRLHWVQFQSKFYKGDGRQFVPLNFRSSSNQWLNRHNQF